MIVLSLFDGMSCGLEALKRANISVTKYYASEIDKYAIQVAKKNHPEIIHLGDVTKWREWDIEKPDLIIGGSPCQGFSFAGKQLAFDDPRSMLFFTMMDIINHYKPKWRYLENVKMKAKHANVITKMMECGPLEMNSALVSAQNRVRLYWANWQLTYPDDRGVLLRDIIDYGDHNNITTLKNIKSTKLKKRILQKNLRHPIEKSLSLTANSSSQNGGNGCTVIKIREKSKTIRSSGLGSYDRHEWDSISDCHYRKLTPIECERLQTLPDGYTALGVENILQELYIDGNECKVKNKCQKNAQSKNVISPSQAGKLNCAISTILDGLDLEQRKKLKSLSIKAKCVNQKNVKINSKHLKVTVLNTINNGKESKSLKLENVKFAIKTLDIQDGEDYAIAMLYLNQEMAMQIKLMKTEIEDLSHTGIAGKNIINQKVVNGFIEKLLKTKSEENCEKEKLFTTLILINLIITKAIFMCASHTHITCLSIDSLSKLQQNCLEMGLLNLKMENITELSNSSRYRMLGNGWTCDMVAHHFSTLGDPIDPSRIGRLF